MEIAGCIPPVEKFSLSVGGEQRDTQRHEERSSEMHRVYRTNPFVAGSFYIGR
jgi:hypothetical protein